jgi:hypothetical protein
MVIADSGNTYPAEVFGKMLLIDGIFSADKT